MGCQHRSASMRLIIAMNPSASNFTMLETIAGGNDSTFLRCLVSPIRYPWRISFRRDSLPSTRSPARADDDTKAGCSSSSLDGQALLDENGLLEVCVPVKVEVGSGGFVVHPKFAGATGNETPGGSQQT
jgi:hypothetical protein